MHCTADKVNDNAGPNLARRPEFASCAWSDSLRRSGDTLCLRDSWPFLIFQVKRFLFHVRPNRHSSPQPKATIPPGGGWWGKIRKTNKSGLCKAYINGQIKILLFSSENPISLTFSSTLFSFSFLHRCSRGWEPSTRRGSAER